MVDRPELVPGLGKHIRALESELVPRPSPAAAKKASTALKEALRHYKAPPGPKVEFYERKKPG